MEHALALGPCKGPDRIGEGGEVDAPTGFCRLDAERDRKMAFAGARRAREAERLTAIDEAELTLSGRTWISRTRRRVVSGTLHGSPPTRTMPS